MFRILHSKLTLRFHVHYIVGWNRLTSGQLLSRRVFHAFYQLYVANYILRFIAILLFNPEMSDHWLEIDPLYFTICRRCLFADRNMIVGYVLVAFSQLIIDIYCCNRFPADFRSLLDDLEKLRGTEFRVLGRFQSNPYLDKEQRRRFLKVYHCCEVVFSGNNLLLAAGFLVSLIGFETWIWSATTTWLWFVEISLELGMVLFIIFFCLAESTLLLLILLLSGQSFRWSLMADAQLLTGSVRQSPIFKFILLGLIGNSHRVHIEIKNKAVKSFGSAVAIPLTYGISLNLLANITFLIGQFFYPLPLNARLVVYSIIFCQISISSIAVHYILRLTSALYCVRSPLNSAVVRLGQQRVSRLLRVNAFYEIIVTRKHFRFSLGSFGSISKRSIVTFLMTYSTAIMFVVTLTKRVISDQKLI